MGNLNNGVKSYGMAFNVELFHGGKVMKKYNNNIEFKAIIAVNDAQDIFVLQSNQACEEIGCLWENGRDYSDNSITLFGASQGFNGEYDFGIDATILETLFERDI